MRNMTRRFRNVLLVINPPNKRPTVRLFSFSSHWSWLIELPSLHHVGNGAVMAGLGPVLGGLSRAAE